jgi:hypothetical protein
MDGVGGWMIDGTGWDIAYLNLNESDHAFFRGPPIYATLMVEVTGKVSWLLLAVRDGQCG